MDSFICAVCGKQFNTKVSVKTHIKYVHTEEYFICAVCGKQLKSKKSIKDHFKYVHLGKNFECNCCNKKFLFKTQLLHHLGSNCDKTFECAICDKQFKSIKSIKNHFRYVHIEKTFECNRCSKKFPFKTKLERHLRSNCDKMTKQENKCNRCSKKFSYKSNLLRHLRTYCDKIPEKDNICAVCGKQFKTKKSLTSHVKYVHLEKKFECHRCGKQFPFMSKLLLHFGRNCDKIPEKEFICAVCGKQFKTKQSIKNHIKYVHLEKKFECNRCSKKFPFKSKLLRHLKINCVKMCQKENFQVCAVCGKQFKTKKSIENHMKYVHNEKHFECNRCSKKFPFKSKLLRHLRTNCDKMPEKENICAVCGKLFESKQSIKNHIKYVHLEKKFECNQCSKKFVAKSKLLRHFRSNCNKPKRQNSHSLKCGFCNSYFLTKKTIQEHFQIDHGIILSWELLHFNSENEFIEFKLNYERETITQFIIRHSCKKLNGTKLYKCHRSGFYECKKEAVDFSKVRGSKKIQSYCPSEMHVKYFEDGKYEVNFQKIHVCHIIGDQNNLCHIYLNPDKRPKVPTKIHLGVPKNTTCIPQVLTNPVTEGENKLQPLSNQNVQNVVANYNIQNEFTLIFDNDLSNVDTFVEKHAASVLFLKKQLQEDIKFNALVNDDFALIFMNEFQERNLRRYGNNIITFDRTHGTNKYKFMLHTLLVMDINYQGIPAAFLISNRNDDVITNIFLQCIKEKIGVLNPHVIMSDMQPTYENSWVTVMQNEPNFALWCSWHVRTAWLKNYGKISNKEKRNEVKKTIMNFTYELDPALFQLKLNEFLSSTDVDLTDFISYFRRQFVENERTLKWAYCYQKCAGINTNVSLESYHKVLKYIYGKGKDMDWLTFTLHCIEKYLSVKEISEEIAFYIGVRTRKLNMLRKNHYDAKKTDVMSKVHVVNSNSWLVESFKKPNTSYFVEKREIRECSQYEDVNCKLYCDFCKICFHEYSCNCLDAVIRNNMCKHIHAVGIVLSASETHIAYQSDQENSTAQITLPINWSNESSFELKQEIMTVQFQGNEVENTTAFEKNKLNIENWFHEILKKITKPQILAEIEKRFLKPIEPTINALSSTQEIELRQIPCHNKLKIEK